MEAAGPVFHLVFPAPCHCIQRVLWHKKSVSLGRMVRVRAERTDACKLLGTRECSVTFIKESALCVGLQSQSLSLCAMLLNARGCTMLSFVSMKQGIFRQNMSINSISRTAAPSLLS